MSNKNSADTVLVTGGAGFVGSHFIELLLQRTDARVVCLDNFNDYYDPRLKETNASNFAEHDRVEIVRGDFTDAPVVDGLFEKHRFGQVMHLGAYAGVRYSVANPHTYFHNNVTGTLNLLEAARKHPVEQFVLASSSTVYGNGAEIPFSERGVMGNPASPYGASKRAAELLGLTYFELHKVPVVCVRPFSVYGPRLRPDLALSIFTSKILNDEPITIYGDGSVRRDFTHVFDICDGLFAALNLPAAVGETFNLGHSEPVAIIDLVRMIENAIGKQAQITFQPGRKEDLPVTFANLKLAEDLLGYSPQVGIDQGIEDYVRWFRDAAAAARLPISKRSALLA